MPPCLRAFLPAFSLAEMMIALAILAMGLLVISAALPVGVRYTRTSINIATGEAAAEYALDLIEQSVCIPRQILDVSGNQIRETGLFVPRDPANGSFDAVYEPVIKVRPLFSRNIQASPGTAHLEFVPGGFGYVSVEEAVRQWFSLWPTTTRECDRGGGSAWMWPAIATTACAYPPVGAHGVDPNEFCVSSYWPSPYQARSVLPSETADVADQRTVWVAFYRRVSYASGASDPFLYELITVAVRLPSARHRFPVQDPTTWLYMPNNDSVLPVPWLVGFLDLLPAPIPTFLTDPADPTERFFADNFVPPATLDFNVASAYGPLLPPGSVVVPAVNDRDLTGAPLHPFAIAGFTPTAREVLPIYEVSARIEQPDGSFRVVVKNNGFYPWVDSNYNASAWPVWVIPPAFEELAPNPNTGQLEPAFPDRSPIVAVARRYVRLREVP